LGATRITFIALTPIARTKAASNQRRCFSEKSTRLAGNNKTNAKKLTIAVLTAKFSINNIGLRFARLNTSCLNRSSYLGEVYGAVGSIDRTLSPATASLKPAISGLGIKPSPE
jgi:hypothetical protein